MCMTEPYPNEADEAVQSVEPITSFEQAKSATARDLLAVAELLTEAAAQVDQGDIERADIVFEKWSGWGQILYLRHSARIEQLRDHQDAQDRLFSKASPQESGSSGSAL